MKYMHSSGPGVGYGDAVVLRINVSAVVLWDFPENKVDRNTWVEHALPRYRRAEALLARLVDQVTRRRYNGGALSGPLSKPTVNQAANALQLH